MSEFTFDVFICCHPKDLYKLRQVVRCVRTYIPQAQAIHVSTPVHQKILTEMPVIDTVHYHYDNEVLDIPKDWKFRPNWIYQQLLKLFQGVTSDWYLVIDCDLFVVKPLEMRMPTFLHGRDQHNESYFNFTETMFGFGREYKHSFIADMMLFYRPYIQEMVAMRFDDQNDFIQKSYAVIDGGCQLSEYECYGNFIRKHKPGTYEHRRVTYEYVGRSNNEHENYEFTEQEIERMVSTAERSGLQLFAIHSWI